MYNDRPVSEYLNDLAAKKPAPGGGSAAALSASIGAGLMSMVANFTIGNPKYKDAETKMKAILGKTEKARAELQKAIDDDVEAYNKVSAGIKACLKDPAKSDILYKEAALPPFMICKITSECLKACEELAEYGNKNLITDTAIAAILLEGAFFSAKYNVYINLKYIKDMDYIAEMHKILSGLEEKISELKTDILEKCEDVISK